MPDRRRVPSDTKQDRYDRDHVVVSESSLRKAWPRKKRWAHKKVRAATREVLAHFDEGERAEAVPPDLVPRKRRRKYRKKSMTVRERVELRLRIRRSRLGWNFFKGPYSPEIHREKF